MKNFEQKEHLGISTHQITSKELEDIIYKGERIPQDNRFSPPEKGGVFHYFDPRDLFEFPESKSYVVIKEGPVIVGLAGLEKDPSKKTNTWIKFISVDPAYQNKGYGTMLISKICEVAKQEKHSLQTSFYSDEGEERLKKNLHNIAKDKEIPLIDNN